MILLNDEIIFSYESICEFTTTCTYVASRSDSLKHIWVKSGKSISPYRCVCVCNLVRRLFFFSFYFFTSYLFPVFRRRTIGVFSNVHLISERPSRHAARYDCRELSLVRNPIARDPRRIARIKNHLPITSTVVVLLAERPCLLLATHV